MTGEQKQAASPYRCGCSTDDVIKEKEYIITEGQLKTLIVAKYLENTEATEEKDREIHEEIGSTVKDIRARLFSHGALQQVPVQKEIRDLLIRVHANLVTVYTDDDDTEHWQLLKAVEKMMEELKP